VPTVDLSMFCANWNDNESQNNPQIVFKNECYSAKMFICNFISEKS